MRKHLYIVIAILYSVLCIPAAAQDFARITERTISGTARYIGMAGAMSAIGGDPSAALDNPAGLGLYRHTEVLLSLDHTWDFTRQNGTTNARQRNIFGAPQASLVVTLPTDAGETGVQFNNIMISYRRLHSYNRTIYASAANSPSLGALLASTGVDMGIAYCADPYNAANTLSLNEFGATNEFSINWAMNISNRWYVGAGLNMMSYSLSSEAQYNEDFFSPFSRQIYNTNSTTLQYKGVGCALSAGLIYRPAEWVRIGFGIQTPSLGSLRIYSTGTLYAQTDSLRSSIAPDLVTTITKFHQPLRTSASVAFQIGLYGMIALQYDFLHRFDADDVHTLKAGVEVIPVPGLYLNAGYAYESTFKTKDIPVSVDPILERQDTYFQRLRNSQYASFAIGYRGANVIVQAAYQFRWQNTNLYAHENITTPYMINADTHRFVVTFGWHHY